MAVNIKINMIAPCGMNCSLCWGHHREKNKCDGCNTDSKNKVPHCFTCSIKNCGQLKENGAKYCFACPEYPCRRLKSLDKRYRTKYGMSMVENLNNIKTKGIRNFIKQEKIKWSCSQCGKIISVHREQCVNCGAERKN